MKKILSLLSLLMLFVMTASADTVVLSAPTSSAKTHSDADGIITITDATDNTGIQVGSGKLDYDGGSATPMKLSGTRQFNLSYSAAVTVTKVWLYATNAKASTASDYKAGTIGLDSKDRTSLGNLPEKGATPLKVDITGKAGLNANTQFLAVIVVEYSSTAPSLTVSPKELSFSLNPSVTTKTQSFTLTGKNLTNGTYDLAVPSVTGLTVTPTQFTVAEGAVSQEVQVTYASTEAVAKATADITATVGEQTAKVTLSYQSRAVAYTQSTVSDAAVWDWTKVTGSVELTAETTPTKEDEFLLADVDDRVEFPAAFGDAKALMMTGFQYPTHSAGYAQGKTIKFKTSVPGVLTVEFSNTGTSDRPDRYLNVNGVNTTFKSKNTDKVTATDINVPAGEVVLMGNMVDTGAESGFTPNMLRWYKITFTPILPDATFDFKNNPQSWPYGEGTEYANGDVKAPIVVNGVSLIAIQGTSLNPVRIMKNASRGIFLQTPKGAALKLEAPDGKAIVGVTVTMQTGSFDLEPNTGAVADNAWTGNATSVTFFNLKGQRYIHVIDVVLADKTTATEEPDVPVEVANIAAFNALPKYKYGKLTLTDAVVNGYWDLPGNYYVEDATGAVAIKGVALTKGTKLNGTIIGMKDDEVDGEFVSYSLSASDLTGVAATETTLAGTVMTAAEAAQQANFGKLITLENVSISGDGKNKTLTDAAGNQLDVLARDYMGVLPTEYAWPAKASKLTGILVYYVTGWYLMPISAEAIVPYVQPTEVTFDFTSADFRGYVGTSAADKAGWILNETQASDFVSIQITAGSSCSRINETSSKPACLTMDKEFSSMTIKAPEGYAITKVEFTTQSETGKVNFTPSSGSLEDKVWTGNAEGVRFNTTLIHYLNTAKVTLAEKNGETTALPAINYTECANIAAFNALDNGTYAKVTLTDAEVIGKSGDNYSNVWVQDATGGCWIQYSSLFALLEEKTKLNGYFYVVKRYANNNNQMKETEDTPKSVFSAEEISDYTMIEGTIAEVNKPENMNRVVKISGAKFVATSATAGTLTQGETTLAVSKGAATQPMQLNKLADQTWVKDETTYENVTVIGIILNKNSGTDQHILPISMTTTTGIRTVGAANENVQIYNLQGVRLNQLQRGLNIVNGKKIVVK